MSEPTTCARCGMTDQRDKDGFFHANPRLCIVALGAAVRELQARQNAEDESPVPVTGPVLSERDRCFTCGHPRSTHPVPDFNDGGSCHGGPWLPPPNVDAPQPDDGPDVAPRASAGSNVGAPEVDETMAEIERLVDAFGVACMEYEAVDEYDGVEADGARSHKFDTRNDLLTAIRAALRAPTIPDPDTLEAWADQPIHVAADGLVRFVANPIVRDLLDHSSAHGMDMNALACEDYPRWARVQFAQLIGYSVRGYDELSYVSDEDSARAHRAATQEDTDG